MHLYFFKILNQYFNRLSKESITEYLLAQISKSYHKMSISDYFWMSGGSRHMIHFSQELITNQEEILTGLINNYVNMGCNYSPKMHYIHCHFKHLITKQAGVSDEHGEKMHQTMRKNQVTDCKVQSFCHG